jgi:hypothetical protein
MKKQTLMMLTILFACSLVAVAEAEPIQWLISDGGNGHYYEAVFFDGGISWKDANNFAQASVYLGVAGHLATITSQAENDFITNNILGSFDQGLPRYWLGGYQPIDAPEPATGWRWITGETWAFTNWPPSYPNDPTGNEDLLDMFSHPAAPYRGTWNDSSNWMGSDVSYYIVEYPVPEPTCGFSDDFDGTVLDKSLWSVFVDALGQYHWPYVSGGFLYSQGYHTRIDSIPTFAPMGQSVIARARIKLGGIYNKFGFAINPNERTGPITGYYFDTVDVSTGGREHYIRALAWSKSGSGTMTNLLDVEIPVSWYDFHEFAIRRTPSEVIYSIDGEEVARVTDSFADALPAGVWNDRSSLMLTDWVEVSCEPANIAPIADAGKNIQIASKEQPYTVIQGAATDPDGDELQYRWFEDSNTLVDWNDVGPAGEAYLGLGTLPYFTIGNHTLTLEVRETGECGLSASDQMILTVDNSPPEIQAAPNYQVVEVGIDPIIVVADAADYDGDTLLYEWLKDSDVLQTGTVTTPQGGDTVTIPDLVISAGNPLFPVGLHTIELWVNDGVNADVNDVVSVEVTDTTAPTLSPVPSVTILWPPNHKLVPVTIQANAFDNGGGSIDLNVTVASSEPADDRGDGNTECDYYIDSVDDQTGVIELRLRAERSGKGDGRTYTVTIIATDESSNQSVAIVEIFAPHDKRKK